MAIWFALLLALTFAYGYLNGQTGSASVVSAMVSSRSIAPRPALWMAAAGMALGPFALGTAVAATVGSALIRAGSIDLYAIIAALIGAIFWSLIALWKRLPISVSQAFFGSLIGAVVVGFGTGAILFEGLLKLIIGLFISPLLGLVGGWLAVRLCYRLAASSSPAVNTRFQQGQVLLSFFLALSFGSNDAQKLMGIVLLGLASSGFAEGAAVPLWLLVFSAVAIAIGTLIGAWRLIHTLGGRLYRIRPVHGFGAQLAATGVLFGAGLTGLPVSGSQIVTSSIVGAGSAERVQQVRWGVFGQIVGGWALTLPASGVAGALAYALLRGIVL